MKKILLAGNSEKTMEALRGAVSSVIDDALITVVRRRVDAMVEMGSETDPVDLLVINTPMADAEGPDLARSVAEEGRTAVIVITAEQTSKSLGAALEGVGIIVLTRPIDRKVFLQAVKDALIMQGRLRQLKHERDELQMAIEEVRLVNRAKAVLMNNLGMKEAQAHHYIEKQAMDLRTSKRKVAQTVLQTYYKK